MKLPVLQGRDYADADSLLAAAAGQSALLVVPESWMGPVLSGLQGDQDVVSEGASPALIAHRLERLADALRIGHDRVTGLWARQPFVERLQAWPSAAAEPGSRPVRSVLIIDLDRFKAVNDQHGHGAGDEVLAELGERIRLSIPPWAFAARLGGEEVGIFAEVGYDAAMALARKLHGLVRERPFTARRLRVTASVGVATDGPSVDASALLGKADGAVYAAKAAGRDTIRHASDLEREAMEQQVDPAIQGFENMTRVIAERVADVLTRRGRQLFQQLQQQAEVDSLTGAFSRRYMDRRLAFEVGQYPAELLSATLIDIDHFGQVNKTYGWPAGDRVLAAVAARLASNLRESDWLARYGGEEFVVVLSDTRCADAVQVVERLRQCIDERSFDLEDGGTLHVTISAGVAARREGEDVARFTERLSQRLLRAKNSGRNCVVGED